MVKKEKIKVLVAEDETDIRELIAFSLRFAGYEVVEVTNGEEAVEKANIEQPNLIMLDALMPKMTGYEACKKLQTMNETRHIPIVFLSALGQKEKMDEGLAQGAVAYILKPFAPEKLIKQVANILAEQREA